MMGRQVTKILLWLALLITAFLVPISARAQTSCSLQTKGQLLSSFSDNVPNKDITPQTIRNFVCSVFPIAPVVTSGPNFYNVLSYGTMALGTEALNATCAAATGAVNTVYMPTGNWLFDGTATACAGKNIAIIGDGSKSTIITASTSAEPIQITQTAISQTVQISGLGFSSTATSGTTRAIDVSWPAVSSYPAQNFSADDIAIYSSLSIVASPYPNSYLGGIRLNGAWFSQADHVTFTGPATSANLPVSGVYAIELQSTYSLFVHRLISYLADAAIAQSAYGEFIDADMVVVNCNYGLEITNGPDALKGNLAGVSYYIHDSELDVVISGAYLNTVANAWLYGNHIALGRAAGGEGFLLNASANANVFGNKVEQNGSNITGTGVLITGASGGNFVHGNTFSTATDVYLDASTVENYVLGNSDYTGLAGFPSPTYTDAGTNNTVSWPGPNGLTKTITGQTLGALTLLQTIGAAGQASMAFTLTAYPWSELEIHCTHMMSSVAGDSFSVQLGTSSGPTYATSGYQNSGLYSTAASATPTGYASTTDAGMGLLGVTWSSGISGDLYFIGKLEQHSGVAYKSFMWQTGGLNDAGTPVFTGGSGASALVGSPGVLPITGIRVQFSSGTITDGACSLYGVFN